MKRWKIWLVAVIVIILAVCVKGFWFTEVITHRSNEANRQAIVKLHGEIALGDTREQVLRHYYALRTDSLRLHCDWPEEWIISMPLEFGALNWTLMLKFDQDRISAVRVRTSDGPKPNASPDDKAMSNKKASLPDNPLLVTPQCESMPVRTVEVKEIVDKGITPPPEQDTREKSLIDDTQSTLGQALINDAK